jgi:hypothetical protein
MVKGNTGVRETNGVLVNPLFAKQHDHGLEKVRFHEMNDIFVTKAYNLFKGFVPSLAQQTMVRPSYQITTVSIN